MYNQKNRILSVGALLLFTGYFACITFFTHIHEINSHLVVHSHPLSSETHHHSPTELLTIQALSLFLCTLSPVVCLLVSQKATSTRVSIIYQDPISNFIPIRYSLRAPPIG